MQPSRNTVAPLKFELHETCYVCGHCFYVGCTIYFTVVVVFYWFLLLSSSPSSFLLLLLLFSHIVYNRSIEIHAIVFSVFAQTFGVNSSQNNISHSHLILLLFILTSVHGRAFYSNIISMWIWFSNVNLWSQWIVSDKSVCLCVIKCKAR